MHPADGKIPTQRAHLVRENQGTVKSLDPCSLLARRPVLAFGLALALGAITLAAPGAGGAEDTWYAQRFTTGDAPVRVDQLWSSGPRLRSETVIAGRPILQLVSGERYYIVDRLAGSGISVRRSPAAIRGDARRGRPFGNEAQSITGAGGEQVGTQRLGARECVVYRLTGREGRREVCVTPDEARLPIQMETWNRASGQSSTVRYLDWTRGLPVPDRFFEPDPSWKLEHLDYEDYRKRSKQQPVGPAPPFYGALLHGRPD
jgi:hypothetical protein